MSRSIYMPTRSYSSTNLVKTAQERSPWDRFIEYMYFGGSRLESKSTVFGTMMNELRNIDNKIRATLLNKTISKQTPYPNENMGSAKELLKNAQRAYDSKEYLLAISYLEQFYVKALYCAQLLKNLDSIVAELNKEYYKSLLEPLNEDQIERIKKFLKDKKEAAYLPEDTRKEIEEGEASIKGKLSTTTSARYRLNKRAAFYKQAGLISWIKELFNSREAALTLWERIQPGASKDLKRDIARVLSASNRLFNVFENSLEIMSSARANREIAKYQTAAKTIPAQVNSYSELVNNANFNKYTEQLNEVLASIATPQQAAKAKENTSPSAAGLAAQVASGNTGSPVGAGPVYSLGSGKNIGDFNQGQRVYVFKDRVRINAIVNNVDTENNKISVNLEGFPGPILLNPNQVFISDEAVAIVAAANAGAANISPNVEDPVAAATVLQEISDVVAGDINNAAAEPPQPVPDPVNPSAPQGVPPASSPPEKPAADAGGAAAADAEVEDEAEAEADAGAGDAGAVEVEVEVEDGAGAGAGAGAGEAEAEAEAKDETEDVGAGAKQIDLIKIKKNAFTLNKVTTVKKNNIDVYNSTQIPSNEIIKIIDKAISFLKSLGTDEYIELGLGSQNKKIKDNYIINARRGRQSPGFYVDFNINNKTNTTENYQVNFAFDPSDEYGKKDPESNEQKVADDKAAMKVDIKDLNPNNTYEVRFTIDKFIEYCQDIGAVERDYYASILKKNFGDSVTIPSIGESEYLSGSQDANINLDINFNKEKVIIISLVINVNDSYNEEENKMETLTSPEDKTLTSEIPFSEVEFYQLPTKSSSFTYALQALSNESPIIVASFIRRYANLIQNKNKKLSNNLHKIASRIK